MKRQQSILLAEDNDSVRELLRLLLTRYGFRVTVCNNGSDALEAYRATRPDLVLTDVRMEPLDGIELAEAVHTEEPDAPVLFISGAASEDDVADRLHDELERNHHSVLVLKPFDVGQLVRVIEELIHRRVMPK